MPQLYTVKTGDSLSSIARRFGCEVSSLQSTNRVTDPRKLQVGAVLQIPTTRLRSETERPVDKAMTPPATLPSDGTPGASLPNWTLGEIWNENLGEGIEAVFTAGVRLSHRLSKSVLGWYRENESAEVIITADQTKTEPRKADEQKKPKPATKPKAKGAVSAAKKHKDEVIAKLRERLYAVPHVVSTSGMRLSRNERRMIVAAVGLCEIDNHVFGSRNLDFEFVGRKFGQKGIETSYSRIVHIGLSYGYIQYTQDSGSLGKVLKRMQEKSQKEFEGHFPNFEQLIQMTTSGLPGKDKYGASGQKYWNDLRAQAKAKGAVGKEKAKELKELQERANTDADKDDKPDKPLTADEEIRGARVQKIPYVVGYPAIDLWEDYKEKPYLPGGKDKAAFVGYLSAFKAAGDVPAFQDAQIELAVEDYMNPALAECSKWNIRSAIGLAFVVACAVRGGTGSQLQGLLMRVAAAKLKVKSFESSAQERECVKAIADAKETTLTDAKGRKRKACEVSGVEFHHDEARRAALILKDEYDFLREDFYDPKTYDAASDK